ncbi:hypothetical protein Taro_025442, partial [Colocasia esculenta]|nr:hypothetical protein [Colocasia esculenta]
REDQQGAQRCVQLRDCTQPSPCVEERTNRELGVGRVEELLVAEELWNDHKKPFFFPFSSATTCTNHPLEVDQRKDRSAIQGTVLALSEPGTDPVNATARYVAFRGLIATYPLSPSQGDMRSVSIRLPDLTTLSRCSHPCVAFWARPTAFLIWLCRDLRIFTGNHFWLHCAVGGQDVDAKALLASAPWTPTPSGQPPLEVN